MDIRYRLTTKAIIIPACGACGRRGKEREYACACVRFKSALHHRLFPFPVLSPPCLVIAIKSLCLRYLSNRKSRGKGKGKKHLLMTLTQRASFALFFPPFFAAKTTTTSSSSSSSCGFWPREKESECQTERRFAKHSAVSRKCQEKISFTKACSSNPRINVSRKKPDALANLPPHAQESYEKLEGGVPEF